MMDAAVSRAAFNRTFTILDASGSTLQTGVSGWIGQANSLQRAEGQGVLTGPVDASLRALRNDYLRPGHKILVTAVNGIAVTPPNSLAVQYAIQRVDDVAGLGRQCDCALWRESGAIG
jgi:hypothetical protein